jgi:WD40 repeat protein
MSPRHGSVLLFLCLALAPTLSAHAEPPRTDRYGDPLPFGATARLGTTRLRPGDSRGSFALSPDGKLLATGEQGKLRLWDLASGKEVRAFDLPDAGSVDSIRFSPDGRFFAAACDYYTKGSRLWGNAPPTPNMSVYVGEVGSGEVLHQLGKENREYDSLAFLDGSKTLLAWEGRGEFGRGLGNAVVWDVETGEELRWFSNLMCCAVSPDGKTLAGGNHEGIVFLWDATNGRELLRFKAHSASVRTLAFSPDGKLLTSCAGQTRGRWDFFASEKKKPTEEERTARLWDVATGKKQRQWKVEEELAGNLQFSPDGRTLLSHVTAGSGENLMVWDVAAGSQRRLFPDNRKGFYHDELCCEFSPDGKTLLWSINDGVVHHWDIASGKETDRWKADLHWVISLEFTPDGKTLVTRGDGFHVWDAATRKESNAHEAHRRGINKLAFSPDGKVVASLDEGHSLRLWDAATSAPLPPLPDGRQDRVYRFGFCDNGKALVAVGGDATVRIWEVATGRKRLEFPVGTAKTALEWEESLRDQDLEKNIVFGPGYKMLAVKDEKDCVQVWDIQTGKKVIPLVRTSAKNWYGMSFSPDGRFFAVGGLNQRLHLFELASAREVQVFHYDAKPEIDFRFSPDSRTLAWTIGSKVHLWDLAAGRERGQWTCSGEYAFDRDGKLLALESPDDKTRFVRDVTTGRALRRLAVPDNKSLARAGEMGHEDRIIIGRDGRLLARLKLVPSFEDSVYELATGREIVRGSTWSDDLDSSHDGKTLARREFSRQGKESIVLTEQASGGTIGEITSAQRGSITVLAFSPDGRTLATGGADSTVLLWDWARACGVTPGADHKIGPREREKLWADLVGDDAAKAYRAIETLAASGEDAVTFLKERVRPVTDKDWEPVRRLVTALGADEFVVREKATRELAKLGMEMEPILQKALADQPALEARRRIEAVLTAPAMGRWSPEFLRQLRAVQALERIGSPAARQLLEELAKGVADSRLTDEAKAALGRLAAAP